MKYNRPENCMYVKHIEPELWDFTNRYLDTYDHNSLCDRKKTPEHYYLSLITHFLSTKFDYEDEPIPEQYKHIKISLDGLYLKKINKNFENMLYNQSVTNYIKWLIL